MAQWHIGDIIKGEYVNLSPRYYIITVVTRCKVRARRLKVTTLENGDTVPGTTLYGPELTMIQKDDTLTHYGMICRHY